jgi:hypothetical protein
LGVPPASFEEAKMFGRSQFIGGVLLILLAAFPALSNANTLD